MHTGFRTLLVVTLAVMGASTTALSSGLPRADPPVSGVISRAVACLDDYRRAFSFLVADEHYTQQVAAVGDADARGLPTHRQLRGELFLTYLEADRRWIALHDVAEVDGIPVLDRDGLRALLATSTVETVAGRLYRHNARFNVGAVTRTFNEPTLVFQVLDDIHRSRFVFHLDRTGGDQSPIVRLAFRERERPTLVRSLQGGPVFSRGAIDLDADHGTIHRTRIEFRHDGIEAELVTRFELEPRLGVWVPTIFTERYVAASRGSRPAEIITTEARYENYRRFEGRARIVTRTP